jgi:hypothetical protein
MKKAKYIKEIKQIIEEARKKAYTAVNFAMVEAYWLIGQRIVVEEQQGKERAEYGKQVIKEVSKALTEEYGEGYSLTNVKNFRSFYLLFKDYHIGQAAPDLSSKQIHQAVLDKSSKQIQPPVLAKSSSRKGQALPALLPKLPTKISVLKLDTL